MKTINLETMKTVKLLSILLCFCLFATSCSDDDDAPLPVNEEELITTLTAVLTPDSGGTDITLSFKDVDGEGGDAPVVTVSGNLIQNVTYNGVITVLDESGEEVEDITEEVEEEDDEHQFFYTGSSSLNISTNYSDSDDDGNPLGIMFTLIAGNAGDGTLTFTLRHEPKKPNSGIDDAGGETDIEVTFDITVSPSTI